MSDTHVEIDIPQEPHEETEKVAESVEELAGSVETLAKEVAKPTEIPQHDHPELAKRVDKVEESTEALIKREVDRTVADMEAKRKAAEKPEPEEIPPTLYTSEETTATTEELAPEPEKEVTIIEPPVARSKPENPPGVWGFLKKMGF